MKHNHNLMTARKVFPLRASLIVGNLALSAARENRGGKNRNNGKSRQVTPAASVAEAVKNITSGKQKNCPLTSALSAAEAEINP